MRLRVPAKMRSNSGIILMALAALIVIFDDFLSRLGQIDASIIRLSLL